MKTLLAAVAAAALLLPCLAGCSSEKEPTVKKMSGPDLRPANMSGDNASMGTDQLRKRK